MAKDIAELQALPQPQSRNEKYLNYIAGRAVDLNLLPDPQSRIEEYLEYLCYNRGAGGGGGQPLDPKTIINAELYGDILKFTHLDNTVTEVPLDDFVKEWKDLDYVEQHDEVNLLEYNKKITGYSYRGNGDAWIQDQDWSTAFVDIEEGKVYTVFRKNQDSNRFIYTNNDGAKMDAVTVNSNWDSSGFNGRSFTVPTGKGITRVAIMFQHDLNGIEDIMVFEGEIRNIAGFIPFADKQVIQIGKEISYAFDNEGTDLKSTTISSVIKELNGKIANAGGGTVTSVNTVQPVNGDVTIGIKQSCTSKRIN